MRNQNESEILLPLTAKEKAVLSFIEGYLQTNGIAPSYQEIRLHFGLASFNSVQRYLQQLQTKKYIYVPGGNSKRAITVLRSSNEIQSSLNLGMVSRSNTNSHPIQIQHEREASLSSLTAESLSLPLLGKVAAGRPIEATVHNEFISVPQTMIRHPEKTYALRVQGESMIEDGIFDEDLIFVQRQETAKNGDTVVAMVNNQATVKRFYLQNVSTDGSSDDKVIHQYPQGSTHLVELRPSNSTMKSLWYDPDLVHIQGIVVGLLRQY